MKKLLVILIVLGLSVPCFADSEVSVGGKTAAAHIIQYEGTSLRPRPYLNLTGSLDCSDTGGKTVCNITGGGAGGAGNTFLTWDVPSGTDPVADSTTDTVTITASGPITITGTAATDTIAFAVDSDLSSYDNSTTLFGDLATTDIDTFAELDAIVADVTLTNTGTSLGGELGGTIASATINDSITVDGWELGASTATTPSANDNDTSIATTAYVQTEIATRGDLSTTNIDTFAELQTIVADSTLLKAGTLSDQRHCIWDNSSGTVICNTTVSPGGGDLSTTQIDTYSELNAIVADVTLTHNGLIDSYSELNTIVADQTIYATGQTDVLVSDGGTGRSTSTTAYGLIAAGTTATGALQTLAAGATTELLVGGGASALPVWTTATGSGSPVRATSPTLVTPVLGTPSSGDASNLTALNATQLTSGTVPVARVGAAHIDAITEIASALKDGTGDCTSGLLCLGDHTHSTTYQPLDSDLTTWAGVTPSANGQSLVSAANYAAMRTLLDLEAGTDFYSVSGADAAFQAIGNYGDLSTTNIDTFSELNAIVADVTLANTGTSLGGELGGTIGSATINDSITVTGWAMGSSTATTPSAGDNDTSLATTAFVQGENFGDLSTTNIDTYAELNTIVADATLIRGGTLTDTKFCVADGTTGEIDCASEGGGTTVTLLDNFVPDEGIPPTSNFATNDTRNNYPVADFNDSTDESLEFYGFMPSHYDAGGVTVTIHWMATSATSGDVVWNAAFKSFTDDADDIDTNAYAAVNAATCTTASASGEVDYCDITFTDGADMDSVAASEFFQLQINRDANNGSDTMTGDAELIMVTINQ